MKFFKNKLAVTVIVLSVTFLGIIVYSVKRNNGNIAIGAAGSALNPIQKVAYNALEKVKGGFDFFFHFSEVKKENEELKKKNVELKNNMIEYDSLKSENDRLKNLLDFKNQKSDYNYVTTSIVGKMGGSFIDGYIINKGKKDGVEKDVVVVASAGGENSDDIIGLVGQVTEVYDNWSKVQCLVNENIAVSAMVQSTKDSSGIVKGYRDNKNNMLAKLYYLPINSEIKEGDIITTSGLGLLYPKDIRIGEVMSVEEDKVNVQKTAVIKPYVNFSKLEELLIIIPKNKTSKEIQYKEG